MHSLSIARFPSDKLAPIFSALPFFSSLQTVSESDFRALLKHCKIMVADPGEFLINAGEFDSWFYFVLSGSLSVHPDARSALSVGVIGPSEVVGALAIIHDTERSAYVKVNSSKRCILLAVDYTPFGELDDFSKISAAGKRCLMQFISERTESRLQAYEQQFPGTDLAIRLVSLPRLPEDADELTLLHYWHGHIEALSELLKEWNMTLENLDEYHPPFAEPPQDVVRDIEQLYFG